MPINSDKTALYGFCITLVKVDKRPLCAKPSTASSAPSSADKLITASKQIIEASPPSTEKRLAPENFVCKYCSKLSTSTKSFSILFLSPRENILLVLALSN